MDADDRAVPDRFLKLRQALQEHPDWDGVCSGIRIFGTVSEGMLRYIEWQNTLLAPEELFGNRFVEIPALHQSGLYPRQLLLEQLGGYRDLPGWPIDIDTWMRLAEARARIGKIPEQLYGWRQHTLQSTRNHGRCGIERLRRCKAHFLLRALPPQVRRLEVWSTGQTLEGWGQALKDELEETQEAKLSAVKLVEWKPRGGRRRGGAARRREGAGGGAAARATVKTEAELEAEHKEVGHERPLDDRRRIEAFERCSVPAGEAPHSSPVDGEAVIRLFAFGSADLRDQVRQTLGPNMEGEEDAAACGGRWARLDWPAA